MFTDARRMLIGVAFALAAVGALFVPGGFVLVLFGVLAAGAFYARRWAAAEGSRPRRVVASLVVAAGVFVVGSIAWLIGVLASAYQCEYDDVHCSSSEEFLAANINWGFLPIAGLSLAAGWLITSRRAR